MGTEMTFQKCCVVEIWCLNRGIGYKPIELKGLTMNSREWDVELCVVNELPLTNQMVMIFYMYIFA